MGGCDTPVRDQPELSHDDGAKNGAEQWAGRRIIDRRQRGPTDREDRLIVRWGIVPGKSLSGVVAGNGGNRHAGWKSRTDVATRRMIMGKHRFGQDSFSGGIGTAIKLGRLQVRMETNKDRF